MGRTTIRIDEHLLAKAKQLAVENNTTLTAVIEDALRERLARDAAVPHGRVEFPTCGEGWLRPGVDIDSCASLLDLMEAPDDPA